MTTLIILGILGGVGAVIAFIALIFAVVNLFREKKFKWGKITAGFISGIVIGGLAGIGIFATVAANADKIADGGKRLIQGGVDKATNVGEDAMDSGFDKARSAISKVTEVGATGVAEGLDGSVERFTDKETLELVSAAKSMSLEFLSSKSEDDLISKVDFVIHNNSSRNISVNDLVAKGVLVAVDSEGFEHPFTGRVDTPRLIPGSKRRQILDVKLPEGITLSGVRFSGQRE